MMVPRESVSSQMPTLSAIVAGFRVLVAAIASSGTQSVVCHHKREVRSGGLIKSNLPDVSLKISLFSLLSIFVFLYFCI